MSTRIIPGYSKYTITAEGVVVNTSNNKEMNHVEHRGTKSVNLVDDAGSKKRIKLQNLIDSAFPECLPGRAVAETNKYRITEDGNVYSTIQGRWLAGTVGENGYEVVALRITKDNPITKYIHILVAKTYVKGYFVGATVNHKDGNKRNNHMDNLEWITKVENVKHAWKTGLCDSKHRKCELSRDGVEWVEFDRLVDAKEYLESMGATLANVSHLTRAAKQNEGLDTPKYLCRGFYVKYK